MDTIVIFNAGKSAANAGSPRIAPETIMHPVISKYVPFHRVEAHLDNHHKREWLRGYDAAKRV